MKNNYAILLILILFATPLWAQIEKGREVIETDKIRIADLPRLIIGIKYPVNDFAGQKYSKANFRSAPRLLLGPEDIRDFYKYTNELVDSAAGDTRYFAIGPNYKSYDFDFWLEIKDNNQVIAALHELKGFEKIANLFTLWDKTDDSLSLNCIFNTIVNSPIGYAYPVEIKTGLDNGRMLIGRTAGGDAGDYWGSLWFGNWQRPCDLTVFYTKNYTTEPCGNGERTNYSFIDNGRKAVILYEELKTDSCIAGKAYFSDTWQVAALDTIDLMKLMDNVK